VNRPARRDGTPERKNSRQAKKKQGRQQKKNFSGQRPQPKRMVTKKNPVDARRESQPYPKAVRLQKYMAQAGVASRRVSEEMIADGRVTVDGKVVRQQGVKVNPANAVVHVDGVRVIAREEYVYLILNKPQGYLSTMADEFGRPCVGDIIAEKVRDSQGLFHVGRLDADTEGLLLLTNDGELAHRLMHPSYEVTKTYMATVNGEMGQKDLRRLRGGIELEDGPVEVDNAEIIDTLDGRSLIRVEVHEGRNHIVRRMMAELGFPVLDLVRTKLANVSLENQRVGSIRKLNSQEIAGLYEAVQL